MSRLHGSSLRRMPAKIGGFRPPKVALPPRLATDLSATSQGPSVLQHNSTRNIHSRSGPIFEQAASRRRRRYASDSSSPAIAARRDVLWEVPEGTGYEWWRDYESMRPNFEDSGFLDTIYAYHRAGPAGNAFGVAHDVAAGAGHTAASIYQHFDRVVLSDVNEASLATARERMDRENIDGIKGGDLEFVHCAAEDLAAHAGPPASADVVTVAEALPMMDAPAALAQFARVLKPGGTLAAWFYGRPLFSEPEYRERCQRTWDHVMGLVFAKAIAAGGLPQRAAWQQATASVLAWLDDVDLGGSGHWADVQRHHFNPTLTTHPGFFTQETLDGGNEGQRGGEDGIASGLPLRRAPSAVNSWSEKLVRVDDAGFWAAEWDAAGVRKYVRHACPGTQAAVERDPEIARLLAELALAMGGEGARRRYTFACALLLARRTDKAA